MQAAASTNHCSTVAVVVGGRRTTVKIKDYAPHVLFFIYLALSPRSKGGGRPR